jgi:hypothetical protein
MSPLIPHPNCALFSDLITIIFITNLGEARRTAPIKEVHYTEIRAIFI